MHGNHIIIIGTMLLFTVISCVSSPSAAQSQSYLAAPKTESPIKKDVIIIKNDNYIPSRYSFSLNDIVPLSLEFEKPPVPQELAINSQFYIENWNQGVDLINQSLYDQAKKSFSKLAGKYEDDGQAYFNLAICYFNLNDYRSSLKYSAYAKFQGSKNSEELLNLSLFNRGFDLLSKNDYKQALQYFKTSQGIDAASQNILYSYMELANLSLDPDNLYYYIYAGDFAERYNIKDENLDAIGQNLGHDININPKEECLEAAVNVLNYCNQIYNNPHTRKSLGILYAYMYQTDEAAREFQLALDKSKDDAELKKFLEEKLIELRPIKYQYHKEIPLEITGRLKDLEFKLAIPQNTIDQEVTDLKLYLNNKNIKFSYAKDSQGAQFINFKEDKLIKPGINRIIIKANILHKPNRSHREAHKNIKLADYNQKNNRYRFYTASNSINILNHSVVTEIYNKLKPPLKNASVMEIVHKVYKTVIDLMEYKMYEMDKRPKTEILPRLKKLGFTGICEDYSVLTVSLLRRFGIPSLNITGPMYNSDIGHCWPAFFLPDLEKPIVVDSTWGDAVGMTPYYFLFNSNLTVIENFGLDSDYIPSGYSIYYTYYGDGKIKIKNITSSIKLM